MASSFLSGLDFFPKNKNEVLERSKIGGLLTIITVSLVAYLFIHEMYDFFVETNVSVAVGVDTDRADSFHVNLDIWLPGKKTKLVYHQLIDSIFFCCNDCFFFKIFELCILFYYSYFVLILFFFCANKKEINSKF